MKQKLKYILPVFALVILIIGIVASVGAVKLGWRFFPQAAEPVNPTEIRISNLSDNSATVSFLTNKEILGNITFGTAPEKLIGIAIEPDKKSIHYLELKNLKPTTVYYYKIDPSSEPLTLKTFSTTVIPPIPDEAYGKVKTSDGLPAAGVIVFIQIKYGQQTSTFLSAQTDMNGNFSLDLGNARTADKGDYFIYNRTQAKILVEAQGGALGKANVILSSTQTQPLPDIKLGSGEMVDQTLQKLTPQQDESQNTRSQPQTPSDQTKQALEPPATLPEIKAAQEKLKPTITIPANQVVSFGDIISGTASPSSNLIITIYSDPVTFNAKAGSDGNWHVVIPSNLLPGNHTITVTDANGSVQGSFVLSSNTTSSPEPVPKMPVTGNEENTLMLIVGGVVVLILGIFRLKTES